MTFSRSLLVLIILGVFTTGTAFALTQASFDVKDPTNQEMNKKCITCHLKENKSLVMQWENSAHAAAKEGQVGCYTCHAAEKGDEMGYKHEGAFIKAILSPTDCAKCHAYPTILNWLKPIPGMEIMLFAHPLYET